MARSNCGNAADTQEYDARRMAAFYDSYSVSNDINAKQYGIADGTVINGARHHFFYCSLLPLVCARIASSERIIDIGCGKAILAQMIAHHAASYVGVDISYERVRQARDADKTGRRFFVVADARQLPFKDGVFDKAVSLEVIEHVPDPALVLGEAARVLRLGGTIILSTPGGIFFSDNTSQLYQDQHIYEFNPGKLRLLLKKTGFICSELRGLGFKIKIKIPLWMGSDAVKFVYSAFLRRTLRAGYGRPVSLEFDVVTSSLVQKIFLRRKTVWNLGMKVSGSIGNAFPCLASIMVAVAEKRTA